MKADYQYISDSRYYYYLASKRKYKLESDWIKVTEREGIRRGKGCEVSESDDDHNRSGVEN